MKKKGYAVLSKEGEILYTDFKMTRDEMLSWYRNQFENGCELCEIEVATTILSSK